MGLENYFLTSMEEHISYENSLDSQPAGATQFMMINDLKMDHHHHPMADRTFSSMSCSAINEMEKEEKRRKKVQERNRRGQMRYREARRLALEENRALHAKVDTMNAEIQRLHAQIDQLTHENKMLHQSLWTETNGSNPQLQGKYYHQNWAQHTPSSMEQNIHPITIINFPAQPAPSQSVRCPPPPYQPNPVHDLSAPEMCRIGLQPY